MKNLKEKLFNLMEEIDFMDQDLAADVEEIAASDEVLVMSENDNIVVKSDAVGSPIAVYSVTGALMRTAEVEEGATVIDNIEEGIYLVRVGKNTKKVIVK